MDKVEIALDEAASISVVAFIILLKRHGEQSMTFNQREYQKCCERHAQIETSYDLSADTITIRLIETPEVANDG